MGKPYGKSPFGFEDLKVYQAAQAFRNRIYKLAASLPEQERYALAQQMRRAAISVTNNISEGYGRFTWQETTHFCRHARGSLMELVDDIDICLTQRYGEPDDLADLRKNAERLLQLLNGYIRYLQKSKRDAQGRD